VKKVFMPISSWSSSQKVEEAIRRSTKYMPADFARQVEAMLTPENLAILVGTLVIWAGSHFFGVGEIVDVGLLLVGAFTIGWSIGDVANNLYSFATTAINAQTEQDLDRAAKSFARAVVEGGITTVMALLLRRSARQLQATRGASIGSVARPRNPGLGTVGADSQAGRIWRRPTTTGDPSLPAGAGKTSWFGDMTISTAGSAAEQQLARIHELVHSFLRPRFILLRTFRARLAGSAYWRSVFLRYLEEAMAETIAQLRVNGLSGLLTGVRFPVANGYVTIQQLVCEGAEIGTIVAGTQRFSVQFIPDSPHPDSAAGSN
jgi:hypothetical protein